MTQADMDAGASLVNGVTVTSMTSGTQPVSDTETTPVATNPSLSVTKTASPKTNVPAGDVVTYTYVITNDGNQTIANITINDAHGGSGPAPAPDIEGATLTDNGTASDSFDTVSGDNNWGTLAPQDVLTITATYTVTQDDVDNLQ